MMLPKARSNDLLVEKVADELIVYDQDRERVHRLNPAAALVWQHCDGSKNVSDLALLLQIELGMPMDEAAVWHALQQLDKADLLQDRVQRLEAAPAVTRRQLLRRMGLAGGMAMLLPVITSLVASSPARAQATGTCFCDAATPGLPRERCNANSAGDTKTVATSGRCLLTGGPNARCMVGKACIRTRRYECRLDNMRYRWVEISSADSCKT